MGLLRGATGRRHHRRRRNRRPGQGRADADHRLTRSPAPKSVTKAGSALLPVTAVRPGPRNLIEGPHDHHIRHRIRRTETIRRPPQSTTPTPTRSPKPGHPACSVTRPRATAPRRPTPPMIATPPAHARSYSPRWRRDHRWRHPRRHVVRLQGGGSADRRRTRVRSIHRALARRAQHAEPDSRHRRNPARPPSSPWISRRTESRCPRSENERRSRRGARSPGRSWHAAGNRPRPSSSTSIVPPLGREATAARTRNRSRSRRSSIRRISTLSR